MFFLKNFIQNISYICCISLNFFIESILQFTIVKVPLQGSNYESLQIEKLQTKNKIKKVYLSNKFKDNEIITLIKKKNINPILLDMRDLDKMCKGLHQGIILEVEDVKTTPLEDIPLDVDLVPVTDNDEKEHSSNKDESKNLKEVSDSSENTISVEENNSEEKAKENSEESEVMLPAEEPQKEDSSNEMTYTMDENDTLSNIALALFEDQTLADKAVNKIIKNNKEAIDKRLVEKNITDDKNIATEKGILTGITLNLSKVFEEVVKNNN